MTCSTNSTVSNSASCKSTGRLPLTISVTTARLISLVMKSHLPRFPPWRRHNANGVRIDYCATLPVRSTVYGKSLSKKICPLRFDPLQLSLLKTTFARQIRVSSRNDNDVANEGKSSICVILFGKCSGEALRLPHCSPIQILRKHPPNAVLHSWSHARLCISSPRVKWRSIISLLGQLGRAQGRAYRGTRSQHWSPIF